MRLKRIFIFFLFLIEFSCQNKKILPDSSGQRNEIIIIIENKLWYSSLGDAIANDLNKKLLGIPQEERVFKMSNVPKDKFNRIFKSNKNILIIENKRPENKFIIENNVFAKPQIVFNIEGKSSQDLENMIKEKKDLIFDYFKKNSIKYLQEKFKKTNQKISLLEDRGFRMIIPKIYQPVIKTDNLLWLKKDIEYNVAKRRSRGSLNIFIYLYIYKEMTFDVLSTRDSITKSYIQGPVKGTYMLSEKNYSHHYKRVKIAGIDGFETRGLWQMEGDFMGGPFINYALEYGDDKVIVLDGFIYAPGIEKSKHIMEIEAILKSFKRKK